MNVWQNPLLLNDSSEGFSDQKLIQLENTIRSNFDQVIKDQLTQSKDLGDQLSQGTVED